MIYDQGGKVNQDSGRIQIICPINDYHYKEIMLCDSINNNILHREDKYNFWKLKHITTHKEPIIEPLLISYMRTDTQIPKQ